MPLGIIDHADIRVLKRISGETFEVRFDQVGTFPYYCNPHRSLGMTGTIIVQ